MLQLLVIDIPQCWLLCFGGHCTIIWCHNCANFDHIFFVCWHCWLVTALFDFQWFLTIFKSVVPHVLSRFLRAWSQQTMLRPQQLQQLTFVGLQNKCDGCLLFRLWHCDRHWRHTSVAQLTVALCLFSDCSNLAAGSAEFIPPNLTPSPFLQGKWLSWYSWIPGNFLFSNLLRLHHQGSH
jgi:hypothetical protein